MTRNKIFQTAIVLLVILFMLLPTGAVCRYISVSQTTGMQHEVVNMYSYFDAKSFMDSVVESFRQMGEVTSPKVMELIPFWISNLAPLMCAISVLLLFGVTVLEWSSVSGKTTSIISISLSAVSIICSLIPLFFYGVKFYSLTAMMVSFLLLSSLVIAIHRLASKFY